MAENNRAGKIHINRFEEGKGADGSEFRDIKDLQKFPHGRSCLTLSNHFNLRSPSHQRSDFKQNRSAPRWPSGGSVGRHETALPAILETGFALALTPPRGDLCPEGFARTGRDAAIPTALVRATLQPGLSRPQLGRRCGVSCFCFCAGPPG